MAAVSGGTVTVLNFGAQSCQPDSAYFRVLEQMGCTVSQTDAGTTVSTPPTSTTVSTPPSNVY